MPSKVKWQGLLLCTGRLSHKLIVYGPFAKAQEGIVQYSNMVGAQGIARHTVAEIQPVALPLVMPGCFEVVFRLELVGKYSICPQF